MSDAMENPENGTSDRRNYNVEAYQLANIQKNEVLYKVIELEQKLQEYDSVYLEQFKQIHSLVGQIFDRPQVVLSPTGRGRTSPLTMRPENSAQPIDEPGRSTTPNASSPFEPLTNMDPVDLSESSEDETVVANQPQTETSRSVTPIMEEFRRKVPRLPLVPRARRSQSHSSKRSTPYRAVDEQRKTPAANCSSNFSAATIWVIIIVMVSFVTFVVGEAIGWANIETIAKLSLNYADKFRALMLQSLFEQSKRLFPIDPHTQ